MPVPPQPKSLFIRALAEATSMREDAIRSAIRAADEAGLLSVKLEPFLPQHAVNILLALMAPTVRAAAGRVVPLYAEFPLFASGRPKGLPVMTGERQKEATHYIEQSLAPIQRPLRDILIDVMREQTLDAPRFHVDEIEVARPPHEAVTIRLIPATGNHLPVALTYAPKSGVAMRTDPVEAFKTTTSITGTQLTQIAPFAFVTGGSGDQSDVNHDNRGPGGATVAAGRSARRSYRKRKV